MRACACVYARRRLDLSPRHVFQHRAISSTRQRIRSFVVLCLSSFQDMCIFNYYCRLAATLGSKSKKLGRREVVSADIARLCNLVSQPPEPLALRLSSNLMVGVVRYDSRHVFFQKNTDTTNAICAFRVYKSMYFLLSFGVWFDKHWF